MIGLSFRVYFSPDRIKSWVQSAIENQNTKLSLVFQSARLKLASGAVPQLAIVLNGVEFTPHPDCVPEPSLRVAELELPFRFVSLLRGQLAIGTVTADDIVVDLDRFKNRCRESKSHPTSELKNSRDEAPVTAKVSGTMAKPWWKEDQLLQIQELISGVKFSKVEIQFEDRAKSIVLESFSARSNHGSDTVEVKSDLRIPRELVFGEELPPLSLKASVQSDSMEVSVAVPLSEGQLNAWAALVPSSDGGLEIDARIAVGDVPLSTMGPLLTKTGLAQLTFRPKFLWLDCEARVKGRFQGLFRDNPVHFERCLVEGNGGSVHVDSAVRNPSGTWEPFVVRLSQVDVRRLLETFSLEGPDGVANNFGQLSGEVGIQSGDEAHFKGVVDGAQIRFSSRSVRAVQTLQRVQVRADLKGDTVSGSIHRVDLKGGLFDGHVDFTMNRSFNSGSIFVKIDSLVLDEKIQDLLVGGRMGVVAGEAKVDVLEGGLSNLRGDFQLNDVEGREFSIKSASLKTESGANGLVQVTLQTPEVSLLRKSRLFKSMQSLFFGYDFEAKEQIPIRNAMIRTTISGTGGVSWDRAKGSMEGNRIQLVSTGELTRSRNISGWVGVDYPRVKNLKWSLSGTSDAPVFTEVEASFEAFKSRSAINAETLGLPMSPLADQDSDLVSDRATRRLRELGERVIEKARRIVPNTSEDQDGKESKADSSGASRATSPAAVAPEACCSQ